MLIAVYGTLKQSEYNHKLLVNAKFMGTGWTQSKFDFVDLASFPAVVATNKSPVNIHVEVYDATPDEFKAVERLEGYPTLYERMTTAIKMTTANKNITAHIYYMENASVYGPVSNISDGNWHDTKSVSE